MILGISGGKEDGTTDFLVKAALEECEKAGFKTEFVNLFNKKIEYCKDCGACVKKPECVHDDFMSGFYPKLSEADALIVGSPTYFANVSGRVQTFFERTLPLRRNGFMLKNKVGAGIAVGGARNGGQEKVVSAIQSSMLVHGMIVVGDSPPTAHFGGIGSVKRGTKIEDDGVGVETAKNTGKKVAETLKLIKK